MKYILTLALLAGFFATSTIVAQEKPKKVVIIKKTTDANGDVITERKEATGEDADILIKEIKTDKSLDGVDIEVEIEKTIDGGKVVTKEKSEDITIEKSIENGAEITTYKIVTEEDGNKKVMIWNGDGEMPADMAKKMEKLNIQTEKINDGKEIKITVETEDVENDEDLNETRVIEERIYIEQKNENRVTLGVMIEDDSKGVVVSETVEGSAAEKAGIKSGDTILKIENTYIFNSDMLIETLSAYDKGQKVKITFLRDGKEMNTEAEF